VFLRSDGRAVASGSNLQGQCEIPEPPEGRGYVKVSATVDATTLLLDNGQVVTVANRPRGEPARNERYTQVSCGMDHRVLLYEDGRAIAIGATDSGQCSIPTLPPGLEYTHVSAGWYHTVLLRSDGVAIVVGESSAGQCDVPNLPEDVIYMPITHMPVILTLRASSSKSMSAPDEIAVRAFAMSGLEVAALTIQISMAPAGSALIWLRSMLAASLQRPVCALKLITPEGQMIGPELSELVQCT
jgi:alpha-tubulin suppressor-like RCC1 family protein